MKLKIASLGGQIMKNGKIGVATIGTGRAGMIHAKNYKNRVKDARLVAVMDPDEKVAKEACDKLEISNYYLNHKNLLNDDDVDAVIIATPTAYHRDIVIDAAKSGKDIFCEKPMAMNEAECDDMLAAINDNNIIFQIGFMRRFDASFRSAKKVVAEGKIGEVVLVKSNTRGPSTPKSWMYDIEKSNGPLAEVNSHDIDTIRWYTGGEFETLYAIGGNYRCPDAEDEFPDFYDNVLVTGTMTNGMQGSIDGAQGVRYGYDARVEILGTKGCIFIGQVHEKSITICNTEEGMVSPVMTSWTKLFKDAYLNEANHFIKCIKEDKQPEVNGTDGKMAVKVVEAGNKSIIENKIIRLS